MIRRLRALILVSVFALFPSTALAQEAPPEPELQYLPGPIPDAGPRAEVAIVDYAAAVRYVEALRQLPPDRLIEIVFEGTGAADRMKSIARRESGLGRRDPVPFDPACSAANPRSSARGLFQTLSLWSGTATANGLLWTNVAGPDCLDDVILARKIWDRSGFHPWRV
jgi:hypothetical protein